MVYWILNQVPYSKSDIALHQLWLGYLASLDNLKVWRCLAYVRIPDIRRPKLGPKANIYVLDFSKDSDICIFLELGKNFITEAQDVEFLKDKFIKDKRLITQRCT